MTPRIQMMKMMRKEDIKKMVIEKVMIMIFFEMKNDLNDNTISYLSSFNQNQAKKIKSN
jgi:hypothetical protein